MKSKKRLIAMVAGCLVLVTGFTFSLAGCKGQQSDKAYLKEIDACKDVFSNKLEEAYAQTVVYDIMKSHMFPNTEDGKTAEGKIPKVLFVGYDGALASAIAAQKDDANSAVFDLVNHKGGALYFSYAGGVNPGDQATSTGPGWASLFTGKWAEEYAPTDTDKKVNLGHGVKDNDNAVASGVRSIMYDIAKDGRKASYNFTWTPHETVTYQYEKSFALEQGLDLLYNNGSLQEENKEDQDKNTLANMRKSIEGGYDGIFGTIEYCDSAGHGKGYDASADYYKEAIKKSEAMASTLISVVSARANTHPEEDWLIIITTDHGGQNTGHGGKSQKERITWFASNKKYAG